MRASPVRAAARMRGLTSAKAWLAGARRAGATRGMVCLAACERAYSDLCADRVCSKLCWEAERKHYQAGTMSMESPVLGAFCMGNYAVPSATLSRMGCMVVNGAAWS
eukprot:366349-Chlamydomonas_euryale.AAC.8